MNTQKNLEKFLNKTNKYSNNTQSNETYKFPNIISDPISTRGI